MSWFFTSFPIWLAALATIGIFSFLWRENPVYRFFEHLFMGLALGWGIARTWTDVLTPLWLGPMLGLGLKEGEAYNAWNALWILALPVGAMWYFIFSRKLRWIARIIIGFFIGVGAGIGIRGFFRIMLPQITGSFKSLWPSELIAAGPELTEAEGFWGKLRVIGKAAERPFNNLVFLVTFYCSMVYFLFTFDRERPALKYAASAGRWLMMIAFGAMFGSTVMARLSLLIERVQFLVDKLILGQLFG